MKGFATEFAWMAVWPHVAIDTERGAFDKAADRHAVLVVPWERPTGENTVSCEPEAGRALTVEPAG